MTDEEIRIAQDEINEIVRDMNITIGICPGCSDFDNVQYDLTSIYFLIKNNKIHEALEKIQSITEKMNDMQGNCPGCGRIELIHSKLSHFANFIGKHYEKEIA